MARRQARFTPGEIEVDPRLEDESPNLWSGETGEVARRLLTSAVRCFASNGYHATTTRDISTGAGLSPAAMYVHFPSKELLLYEIMRFGHEAALECIRGPEVEQAGTSCEVLHTIVARYTAWHARHHVAARVCQNELSALTADHYEAILQLRHETNEVLRKAVASGVADQAFVDVDVNRIVRAMLSLSIDLVRWYRLNGPDSPEQLGSYYADLALRMVSSPPSKKASRPSSAPNRRGRPAR